SPGKVRSCSDSNGAERSGKLDTSHVGPHRYSVTAVDEDRLAATTTIEYAVAEPPRLTVAVPANKALYRPGAVPDASFTCQEGAYGPGLTSRVDQDGNGSDAPLPATPGAHSYTVKAVSADGAESSKTVTYSVAAPPTASVTSPLSGGRPVPLGEHVPTSF